MDKNYAKSADHAAPQATGFFCAHNPASTSASAPGYECAENDCVYMNNEKGTFLPQFP